MFVGFIPTPNIMLCTYDNVSVSIMNALVFDYSGAPRALSTIAKKIW